LTDDSDDDEDEMMVNKPEAVLEQTSVDESFSTTIPDDDMYDEYGRTVDGNMTAQTDDRHESEDELYGSTPPRKVANAPESDEIDEERQLEQIVEDTGAGGAKARIAS
jgi:hypothetical protein